ncbi:MAG: alpha/beta fold hydrolase [Saprospiraceae bacterium]|nr:alpha/beta fold hydrolase [Saprospiraceae bacterium]HMW37879.1 alpha/beta fold hydrolase [Saprospiraceae bacterium]HMX87377.1 alpha/beta fold hydrolase [Saprospiraceae bacterium]HMZ39204.1 alpha/beta fold hydrolase [Saprospiraceae bacterium]HNB30758.1 alpha/beta fold hydrolase [Saprospiraceae bacterium]
MGAVALNAKILGKGPDLIILHGLLGSLDNWMTVANQISDSYRVHLIDLRNHGRSPHTDEMNYRLMAEDVLQHCRTHGLNNVFLAGHSMGGKVVLEILRDQGGLVRKAMVIDIGSRAYPSEGHSIIFQALQAVDPSIIQSRNQADVLMSEYISDFPVRQFLLKNLERLPTGGFSWKFNLASIQANYGDIASSVVFDQQVFIPVCFLYGTGSDYITYEDLKSLPRTFAHCRFWPVEGAGHWVHAERPDETVRAFREWFV